MRRSRVAVAAILAVLGLAWAGQRTGVIAGSAMSGSPFWAVIGGALALVGAGLAVLEWRHAAGQRG